MSDSRAIIHHDGSAFTSTSIFSSTNSIRQTKMESQTPLIKLFYPEVTHSPFLLSLHWSKWVTWPCQGVGNAIFPHDLMRREFLGLKVPLIQKPGSDQISRSVVSDSLRPHESQHARPPPITNSRSSLRLTSIESVMPSSHLILCHPFLLLPLVPPSIKPESTVTLGKNRYWWTVVMSATLTMQDT